MASIKKRPDGKWRARYRDAAGKEHAKHFDRRVDAQRWVDEVTASVVTGQYVDPRAGRATFREYAEHWRSIQTHRPATVDHVRRNFTNHVYPAIGDRPLSTLLPSDMKALVKRLSETLAPATVSVIYRHVSAVMKSALGDRRIATSPCTGVSVPKPKRAKVTPLATASVTELAEAVPGRYRALVTVAAATGLRQGEIFGLTVDRVDFLRRSLTVDRQLVSVAGAAPVFGPPKTDAGFRTIPLPQVAVEALAAHLAVFPAGRDGLVFTSSTGAALRRSNFNDTWRAAVRDIGLERATFHELRHYYASLLIRHGESVKTVQARLGHASAVETLDTYSHLWPDSDDRTREAVDSVLGRPGEEAGSRGA